MVQKAKAKPAKKKSTGPDPVGVSAKQRKANPWFEMLAEPVKADQIKKRRKEERAKGSELGPEQLRDIAERLEQIQVQINPLDNERKELTQKLMAHWGHTGIEEIEHPLGKTLISTSFEITLDPAAVRKGMSDTEWNRVTERVLQTPKVLGAGKESAKLRDVLAKGIAVRRLKVSVTPPSSRRPKSGSADDESDD